MTRSVVRRFTTMDDAGNRYVIIEYRTFEESDEIRTDRMSADPVTGQLFETLQGRAASRLTRKADVEVGLPYERLLRAIRTLPASGLQS